MSKFDVLADESGFALATVMGAIALITVIAFGGYFIAQSTLHESIRVGDENSAYQAASSGFDYQFEDFDQARFDGGVQTSPSGYAYGTWQTINGTDRYRVSVVSLGDSEYEMISVGESKGTTETIRARFQSFNLWDMNISGGEDSPMGSGAGFNGNGRIIGKVYCNGDFDWSGNGSIEGGPIFVRHGVFNKQSSGSNVGFASDPVTAYFDNPPTGHTSNMYTDQRGSAPKLVIPWPNDDDMDGWRTMAENDAAYNKLGNNGAGYARHASSASDAQYTVFNGSATFGGTDFGKPGRKVTVAGAIDESTSGDVVAVSGNTLYVNGVVYVDGTLTVSSSIQQYMGKGMLVARDGVVINGRLVPAPYNSGSWEMYDGTPLPITTTDDCLGIATLGNVTQNCSDWVCGAVFVGGTYTATPTHAKFRGSIIANGIDFNHPNVWLVTQPGMKANLPDGMKPLPDVRARSDWIRQ
jgi:hypothetical protein